MATNPVVIDQPMAPAAQPSRKSRAAQSDAWFAFWLVLPAIIVVIGVSIYPVAYAIWTSLHNINPAMGMNAWVGLDNYRNVFVQPEFRSAAWVTFRFAASVTILTVLLGLGMALVLNQPFFGRGLMRSVLLVPWAMSGTVVGVVWAWIYDGGYGTLNGVLYQLGIIDTYIPWLANFDIPILGQAALYLVVIAFVWNSAPMAALFLLAALQAVPNNLYRAAKMDGASAWQRFRYITLPWIMPTMQLVLILATIGGIMAFDLIYFLTRGGPGMETTVFSWLGYNTIFGFFQFGQGTAILLVLTLVALILAYIYMRMLDRKPKDLGAGVGAAEASVEDLDADLQRRSAQFTLDLAELSRASGSGEFKPQGQGWSTSKQARGFREFLIYIPVAAIFLWSLAPVVWLLICSVSPFTTLLSKPPDFTPDITLENYRNVFSGASAANTAGVPLVAQRLPNAIVNSTIVAVSTTIICLILGSLAGYAFSRYSQVKFLQPTLLGMMMTRMIPNLAILVPWFILFQTFGLSNTKQGLIICYVSFCLPLVLWIMKTYFDTVPTNLEKAAAIDGCSRLQTLYRVVLPLAVPGLIAAGLFAFIASWNEFIFALILAQDVDSMTVTYVIAQIFGVILYGPQNYGTLFAAGIIAIIPPVFLAFVFQRFLVQGLTAGSVKG
ncbi:MAG: ABC transporter permease subunit [Thermomicrobiales bacterium]